MSHKYTRRSLVSFEGKCPMNCKHCYSYDFETDTVDLEVSSIVDKLSPTDCDIIYVSQRFENFYDEEKGYQLCANLYSKYQKDIFVITRGNLSEGIIHKLCILNQSMSKTQNELFLAVSVCADKSYQITEDPRCCPSPGQRLSFLQHAHNGGIRTVLMLRPIFPNTVIPVVECTSIISKYAPCIDAVVTSGLIVTEKILERLKLDRESFAYLSAGHSTYLADLHAKDVLYLNVEDELNEIEKQCSIEGIPCFRHSMPALNYLSHNKL